MSQISVGEDIKNLVNDIVGRNDLASDTTVEYSDGADSGTGYLSKTYTVQIANEKDEDKSLQLFLKCLLNVTSAEMPMHQIFANEIYFYEEIYPEYVGLLVKRGVEDGFRNVPKCYGTNEKVIALDNLKMKGYALVDRTETMNDSHITMVMKTYAKFHGVSFAFKDQNKERHEEFVRNMFEFEIEILDGRLSSFEQTIMNTIRAFHGKLDPVGDAHILEACKRMEENVELTVRSAGKSNDSAIVTHGDSWCNNMMFLYEEGNRTNPVDMMILDWQIARASSPVFDLVYAFYTVASQESLDKLEHYQEVYHDELSKRIRQLGSDPEILYPYSLFKKQWKQYARYGFAMSFIFIKMMLSTSDETHDFEKAGEVDMKHISYLQEDFKHEEEYLIRIRALTEHMLKNDFI